jgi:hypothetical protein
MNNILEAESVSVRQGEGDICSVGSLRKGYPYWTGKWIKFINPVILNLLISKT